MNRPTKSKPLRYPINCFGDTREVSTVKTGGFWVASFDPDQKPDDRFFAAGGLESMARAQEIAMAYMTGPGEAQVCWGPNPLPGTSGRATHGIIRDELTPHRWRVVFNRQPLEALFTRDEAIKVLRVKLGMHA